jgi:hypothetical protein
MGLILSLTLFCLYVMRMIRSNSSHPVVGTRYPLLYEGENKRRIAFYEWIFYNIDLPCHYMEGDDLMSSVQQAQKTHLNNIIKKTGKSVQELTTLIQNSGLKQHGELRTMVMRELGLGYGDANALVHVIQKSNGQRQVEKKNQDEILDELYKGAKAPLRPIHEAVMRDVTRLGEIEILPQKGYVSLRRKKQFATIGPSTSKRVEVGLNVKDLPPSTRLIEEPHGSMCNYIVLLTDPSQVNSELAAWLKFAYEAAA